MLRAFLSFTLCLSACTPDVAEPQPTQCGSKGTALTEETQLAAQQKMVTWKDDIEPMLKSNMGDRVYKCYPCHPDYNKAESLMKPGTFASVVASVDYENNPRARMPVGGSRFKKEDLEKLKLWEKNGFPITRSSTPAKSTADNCK